MVFAAGEDQNEADQIPKPGRKVAVKKKTPLKQKRERERQASHIMHA